MSIQVEVRLFASLRDGRFRRETLEFPEGTKVADALRRLAIPADEVGVQLLNGERAAGEHLLRAGDVLSLFPFVAGG
jgi:sulfur carrier protein ThiS